MADWTTIKAEYIITGLSYRRLADKYGVSFFALSKRAQRENWCKLRKTKATEIETQVIKQVSETVINKKVDSMERLLKVADELICKAEQAVSELDEYMVSRKTKTKTVEYSGEKSTGKPDKEITVDEEKFERLKGTIKLQSLKYLASTLKDLKDIRIVADNSGDDEIGVVALADVLEDIDGD